MRALAKEKNDQYLRAQAQEQVAEEEDAQAEAQKSAADGVGVTHALMLAKSKLRRGLSGGATATMRGATEDASAADARGESDSAVEVRTEDDAAVERLTMAGASAQSVLQRLESVCAGSAHALLHLSLERCALQCLPDAVWGLGALQELRLGTNQLQVLPAQVGKLQELRVSPWAPAF